MDEYSDAEEVLRTVARWAACVAAVVDMVVLLLIPGIPIDRDRGGGGGGDPLTSRASQSGF